MRLTAVYDLSRAPPTYDFLTFLLRAEMERREGEELCIDIRPGPKDGFRADNLPPDLEARRLMLEKVVKASVPLVGARLGTGGRTVTNLRYVLGDIIEAAGAEVPRFRSSEQAREKMSRYAGAVVITLREADYWPERNSDLDSWLWFAGEQEKHGQRVVFVRDTAKAREPLEGFETCPEAAEDIDLRCALYAGASHNYAVNNGPCMLLYFGDAPYSVFKQIVPECPSTRETHWRRALKMAPRAQFPWASEDQRLMWCDDSRRNLDGFGGGA